MHSDYAKPDTQILKCIGIYLYRTDYLERAMGFGSIPPNLGKNIKHLFSGIKFKHRTIPKIVNE